MSASSSPPQATAHRLIYAMRRDVWSAWRSLHNTMHALATRGATLESLTKQSDDLQNAAILLDLRSQRATQELLARNRRESARVRARLALCALSCCSCVALLVYACIGPSTAAAAAADAAPIERHASHATAARANILT